MPNSAHRWSYGGIEALKLDGDILKSMFGATESLELSKLDRYKVFYGSKCKRTQEGPMEKVRVSVCSLVVAGPQ